MQMLFICTVTVVVLMMGWFLKDGDPAWGRSQCSRQGVPFALEAVQLVYILPPIAVLAPHSVGRTGEHLRSWCCRPSPVNIGKLLNSSLTGYVPGFLRRPGGLWTGHVAAGTLGVPPHAGGQGISTRLVRPSGSPPPVFWSMWLVQDPANIFVFLPRKLDFFMAICTACAVRGPLRAGGHRWWTDPGGASVQDEHVRPAPSHGDRFLLRPVPSFCA
ncbi:MAG: hypothetical protein CM15mP77_0140 [Synechococcus sp.]|nr:MAG: hypothetical protein CM15mP77_0140 [Synechococcus sp.]